MMLRFILMCVLVNLSWHVCRSEDTIKWHPIESKRIGFASIFPTATESWRAKGIQVELSSDESHLRVRRDGDVLAHHWLKDGFWGNIVAADEGSDIFALSNLGNENAFQPSTLFQIEFDDEDGSFAPVPLDGSFSGNINRVEINDLMLSPPTKHHVLVLLSTQMQSGEWTHSVRFPAFLDVRTGKLSEVQKKASGPSCQKTPSDQNGGRSNGTGVVSQGND